MNIYSKTFDFFFSKLLHFLFTVTHAQKNQDIHYKKI